MASNVSDQTTVAPLIPPGAGGNGVNLRIFIDARH